MKNSKVFFTKHYVNQIVTQFFAKANSINLESLSNHKYNDDITFISYGILRGTGQIFSKSKNFIYIDHGYINSSKREFTSDKRTSLKSLNGYFRVVKNDLYFNRNFNNPDNTRFNELDIKLKNLNKNGKKIILSEPSDNTLNFLKIPNWTNETIEEIKKYTDRDILIHNKFSKISLSEALKDAYAFVSCQSTAAFQAIIEGVPSYFTHNSLKHFGEIKNIEDRKLNHSLLYTATNSQWKLTEFFSNDFKNFLDNI